MSDDLEQLAADLTEAGRLAGFKVNRILNKHGVKIRDEARDFAPRTSLPQYARTITHEVITEAGVLIVEIGPEVGGQGSLGHILENGTEELPPQAHVGPAFDRGLPGFVHDVADEGGRIL